MNGRFPIALHILTLLDSAGEELLSSDYIAGSVNINPVLVRKELSSLRNCGLVQSKEGKTGGYSLAKPAKAITLADVYLSVKQSPILGVAKNTPNPVCPVGKKINEQLEELYEDVDKTVLNHLKKQTLESFCKKFK